MRILPILILFACDGDIVDERALSVLEEGQTGVPEEDECQIQPSVLCCDDVTVTRLTTPAQHFDLSENDLEGAGVEGQVNYLDETGVIAFTSSCPGDAASLKAVDLRIDEEGVATVTYELISDEGDGTTDPVRPYSVVSILRPATEITDVQFEIALPESQ